MFFQKPATIIVILAAGAISHASAAMFESRARDAASDTSALNAPLRAYRALTLDLTQLRSQLQNAPDEHGTAPAVKLDLPMPDGTMQHFAVWRTQPMAPELAARYPHIRSYVARAIGHPEIEARLDDSPHGFSAMIRSPQGVTMLQPVQLGSDSRYISFRREDLGVSADPFRCLLDSATASIAHVPTQPHAVTAGVNVRTYRLAVAATGEYTQFFGGTVADGLAAIVQAVNRINGIYLDEFSVQFQLVANDDKLVYTNAATDPYSNNNGSMMLAQNQTNINSVIGSANYDFGHVFSTGGGGVAFVGVACDASFKARGVTGSSQPVGDSFWVDYVAHEMGHQMGAEHTFNDNTDGACAGNISSEDAVEPGSGSTIMAYAGICGPRDLQPHSDAFFHSVSLDEITTQLAGGGSACGTVASFGNHSPVIDAMPNSTNTIPMQTPFALTGSASDADGDALTYIWEETDAAIAADPAVDDGTDALFRPIMPTTSPTRLFPTLSRILAHDPSIDVPANGDFSGETWPTTDRSAGNALHFRLTVRDNHASGGATASADMTLQVTTTAGPFRVTAPAGGATWIGNAPQTVTWNVANTDAAPVNCASVDVLYSADGGQTFAATLASAVPNSGSALVTAPFGVTDAARVEVACHDNFFFDISPDDFTVQLPDEIFADGFGGDG